MNQSESACAVVRCDIIICHDMMIGSLSGLFIMILNSRAGGCQHWADCVVSVWTTSVGSLHAKNARPLTGDGRFSSTVSVGVKVFSVSA